MTYIVLWKNNFRAGSVENTPENLAYFESLFYLSLIQRDGSGTVHYEVFGVRKRKRK